MGVVAVGVVLLLEAAPGGHIDLAADDGAHSLRLAGPVERHGPVHDAVIRHRQRRLPQLSGPPGQRRDPAGPVQQRILRVHMKMDKCHGSCSFPQMRYRGQCRASILPLFTRKEKRKYGPPAPKPLRQTSRQRKKSPAHPQGGRSGLVILYSRSYTSSMRAISAPSPRRSPSRTMRV